MTTPAQVNYKQGDRLPPLDVVLEESDGTPVDLTGSTVKFLMRALGGTIAKVDAAASVIGSATLGQVRYEWGASDLDTAGVFEAEFEATSAGKKRTFPTKKYLYVNVTDDVG